MAKPEKILAQELLDCEVMDLGAGRIVGTVVDFAISRDGTVVQMGILPLEWYQGGKGIAPGSITNINADRVIIDSADNLGEFAPDGEEQFSAQLGDTLLGKPVLQSDGEILGELADFWLKLEDGKITDLVVTGGDDKRVKVPLEAIKTIGRDYIVIVRGKGAEAPLAESKDTEGKAKAAAGEQDAGAGQVGPASAPSQPAAAKPQAEEKPQPAAKPAAKPAEEPVEPEEPAAAVEDEQRAAADEAPPEVPPELDEAPPPPPAAKGDGPSRSEEKQALFGGKKPEAGLSKFDQKKCDFLRGRNAHRDIKNSAGELVAAKGDKLDDEALHKIIAAGLLADVFIEMTVNK